MAGRSSKRSPVGFFRTLWRVARQVFHESMGAMFLILALFWTIAGLRQWMKGTATWTWAVIGAFALLLATFGVTSFLAARRVR